MQNDYSPLMPGHVYHLYNHAVGSENLFREDANYSYFLERYRKYISPVCRTFSYALMPNHFHLLVQVRQMEDIVPLAQPLKILTSLNEGAAYVMQQFSNLCNAYAKAYNKKYNRRGALFVDYIRRKMVDNTHYFQQVVLYHHYNPVKHGFCDKPYDYRFTSFSAYYNNQPSLLEREVVIGRFGGLAAFIARHEGFNWRFEDDVDF
mgnify:FL=1